MFGGHILQQIYCFIYFLSKEILYQQKPVCGYIGNLCYSTVRKSTATFLCFPTRWHSPHWRHFDRDCLDEEIQNRLIGRGGPGPHAFTPLVFFGIL